MGSLLGAASMESSGLGADSGWSKDVNGSWAKLTGEVLWDPSFSSPVRSRASGFIAMQYMKRICR
jgi:hypothetical protein